MCTELKTYKEKPFNDENSRAYEPVTERFQKYLPSFEADYYDTTAEVDKMLNTEL